MARYADGTSVPVARSRAEIERTLQRYGADGFAYGHDQGRSMVAFRMRGRQARIFVPDPDPTAREFTHTATGQRRSPGSQRQAHEQAVRQRWRALVLVVKAKLEAVESGISTFDDEFLAHLVLPTGSTVGEWVGPQIADVYEHGRMPALLPGSRSPREIAASVEAVSG